MYDHARTEKEARGVAFARAKRALGRDCFVVLDGMNYIKGFRYQLWCEAKALGTTCCVVCFPFFFRPVEGVVVLTGGWVGACWDDAGAVYCE